MHQDQIGNLQQVLQAHGRVFVPVTLGHPQRPARPRRSVEDEVRAVTDHLLVERDRGCGPHQLRWHDHLSQQNPGPAQLPRQHGVAGPVARVIEIAGLHHQDPLRRIPQPLHVNAETEAIQQLRAQISLFRVHGANQDKVGRMRHRYPLALHHIHPHGGRIEQHVHQMVVQQIHLVDVEHLSVGLRQQPRLEDPAPLAHRGLQV